MRKLLPFCLLASLCWSLQSPSASAAPPARAAKPKAAQPAAGPSIAALRRQADAAQARKTAAVKSLDVLRNQFKSLVNQFNKVKADQAAAQRTVSSSAAALKKQQAAVTAANAANQKAAAALTAAEKALAAAQKAAATAKAKATAAAKSLASSQVVLKKTQASVAAANATIKASAAEMKKSESAITAFQPRVMAGSQELARLSAEVLSKQKAIEAILIRQGNLVSFSEKIAPILARRCLACHNARTAKGRLNLETFASILKGGESGAEITKGKADDSNLYGLVSDGSMPKDADPLTKDEIALIKKWIDTGAQLNAGVSASAQLASIVPKLPQPAPPRSYRVAIPVTAVAFSPDGKVLASSGYHEVILWNPQDGKILRRIANVAERVYDIDFSPDGKTLAVAAGTPGQVGEAKRFNVADGRLLADYFTTNDSVFAVAFSPNGKRLATAGADRGIRVFDVATKKQLVLIEDHADWVMGIAWSPDGTKLASASRDKTSKVFDVTERKIDPTAVALGTTSPNVLKGESLATFNSHGQPVFDVAFSPDGKSVITSGADKQVRVWNPANAKQIRAIGGFGDQVFRIAVTKDGEVASSSADKTARLHKLANGKAVRTFGGHGDWVYSVAINPATKRLATGTYDGEIHIFNTADGKLVKRFIAAPGHTGAVASTKK
jgi:Planctomycete cytochrome C/WD domain, G-beta repeat